MTPLEIAAAIVIFLLGVLIGYLIKRNPHCAGKLIIDEKGETERWSFMMDDDVDDVKAADVIFLSIDHRA